MTFPWSRQVVQTVAWEVLAVVILLALIALWQRRRGARGASRRFLISAGAAGSVVAMLLVLSFMVAPDLPSPPVPFTARFAQNPEPATTDTLAGARQVYRANRAVCHGTAGVGDGPAALTLDPRPVNLRLHVPQHPDGEIRYWIREGVAGTAMPPWRDRLTDADMWRLVHYLRALARGEQ